jgi:dTDP-6-deoxy-L-talose 4-dehydrogenase (NAD+)
MKILVTGATGFIGSYVVAELLKRNIEVIATDRDIEKAKLREWFTKVHFVTCDISDVTDEVMNEFKKADKLIHLAWEGLPNYKELFHFERNLFVQYSFLKKMVTNGISDISVSGTCFEYGKKEGGLSVDMKPDPHNPYALAKDTLRKFLQQLQLHFPFKLKWIRLFYTYGHGQSGGSLLAQLETAVAKGDEVFNMSGGEQLRDYLPVEQMAEKIANFSLDDNLDGVVNCCSGKPISIKRLVEDYVRENGYNIKLNFGYYPYLDYEAMAFWGVN